MPSTPRERARRLRREQTEAERFLWARLRARQMSGAKFRRQCPIGPFIADFCCLERRLIIELDGEQRASEVEKDEVRSDFLRKQGYEVLRFWDHEVFLETELVLKGLRTCWRRAAVSEETQRHALVGISSA
jgi:very-short-patch-repair endonuclease